METGLDGSFSNAEDDGDLGDRELLEVPKRHDGPSRGRENVEDVGQVIDFGAVALDFTKRLPVKELATAQHGSSAVDDGRAEIAARVLDPVPALDQLRHRVVDDILGLLLRTKHHEGEPDHLRVLVGEEHVEHDVGARSADGGRAQFACRHRARRFHGLLHHIRRRLNRPFRSLNLPDFPTNGEARGRRATDA